MLEALPGAFSQPDPLDQACLSPSLEASTLRALVQTWLLTAGAAARHLRVSLDLALGLPFGFLNLGLGAPGSPGPCLLLEPGDEAVSLRFMPQFPWQPGWWHAMLSLPLLYSCPSPTPCLMLALPRRSLWMVRARHLPPFSLPPFPPPSVCWLPLHPGRLSLTCLVFGSLGSTAFLILDVPFRGSIFPLLSSSPSWGPPGICLSGLAPPGPPPFSHHPGCLHGTG